MFPLQGKEKLLVIAKVAEISCYIVEQINHANYPFRNLSQP